MAIELRPSWCLSDTAVAEVLRLGEWQTPEGAPAFELDGDTWSPGHSLLFERKFETLVDEIDFRRQLDLAPGQVVGIAARWTCSATDWGGVHEEGPAPMAISERGQLQVRTHHWISRSIEIETCLVNRWITNDRPADACPDGALLWSDGWTLSPKYRSVLLEGDELRIPVRTVPFSDRYDNQGSALWAVELEPRIDLEDPLPNVATVLLNAEVLRRDFTDASGLPDPSRISSALLCGISVDLVRALTAALVDDLDDDRSWEDFEVGTVGSMLLLRLTQAFGSTSAVADIFRNDQPSFSRRLNDVFAPDSWSIER